MNRGQFIAAAAARCRITTADSLYATIGDRLNDAIHEVEIAMPACWDWLHTHTTLPMVAGQNEYTFTAIAATVTVPRANLAIARIIEARLLVTDSFHTTLPRRPHAELRDFYGRSAPHSPEAWTADEQALWVYPAPDGINAYSIELRVVVCEPDLVVDGDTPLIPLRYHQQVLLLLCSFLYDELQDSARAQAMTTRYENGLKRMMMSARPFGGSGLVRSRTDG